MLFRTSKWKTNFQWKFDDSERFKNIALFTFGRNEDDKTAFPFFVYLITIAGVCSAEKDSRYQISFLCWFSVCMESFYPNQNKMDI